MLHEEQQMFDVRCRNCGGTRNINVFDCLSHKGKIVFECLSAKCRRRAEKGGAPNRVEIDAE